MLWDKIDFEKPASKEWRHTDRLASIDMDPDRCIAKRPMQETGG